MRDRLEIDVGVYTLSRDILAIAPLARPMAYDRRAAMAALPFELAPIPSDITAYGIVPIKHTSNQR
jgi:hypothetical protein